MTSPCCINRCLLAAAVLTLCGAAHAQTQATTDAGCTDASTTPECVAARKRKQDEERANRSAEFGSPQAVGDAPLPPQGEPVTKPPTITRGPLRVRRAEISLGIDHALSPKWVIGGLVGVSRTRLHRSQSELAADAEPGSQPDPVSDTTVHARGTTLAATLTHYPREDVFIDAALAVQRTSLTDDRLVNDLALFSGSTHARAVSLSLTAGGTWRYAKGMAVIPQAGLEYVDSRVDPLQTNYTFVDTGEGPFPGFEVSGQHQKALLALAGAQVQWARSTSFGTLTPYLRTMFQQRLRLVGDDVVATAPGATAVVMDPQVMSSKRSVTLAAGLLTQFPGGVSLFADLGATRGQGQLRETRLAVGIKFER